MIVIMMIIIIMHFEVHVAINKYLSQLGEMFIISVVRRCIMLMVLRYVIALHSSLFYHFVL